MSKFVSIATFHLGKRSDGKPVCFFVSTGWERSGVTVVEKEYLNQLPKFSLGHDYHPMFAPS